ncbi:hypothetical protein FHS32_001805 [Streptomyces albaduncus]|uniref:Uncharacterized protein n=1 Tax=Streptomyces griseoloalbus TaxID=67303 RepID=A0A7W8F6K4_9ACTN|nr:hypothetical protein [Streptomyces albaduncus]GGW30309.1 hypothetical protein GCM10010340_05090 [Streptomyces albaduncus]
MTAVTDVLPGDAAGHLVEASRNAESVVVGRHRRRLPAPARMTGSVIHAVLLHAASPADAVRLPPVTEALRRLNEAAARTPTVPVLGWAEGVDPWCGGGRPRAGTT